MKNTILGLSASLLFVVAIATGCCPKEKGQQAKQDTLFQYSTLSSLLVGVYDGEMTSGEVKKHGGFGLGTFNGVDGEMVVVDNEVYQVKADGVAYKVDDSVKTPFAAVTHFKADQTIEINDSVDCTKLKELVDAQLPSKNIPYAIKIESSFPYVKTRSEEKQEKPYPNLVDVLKNQVTFELQNTQGVIVGFRLPIYMDKANAGGYHFHYITNDRKAGGHVLDCKVENVKVEVDYKDRWDVVLPNDQEFYNAKLGGEKYQ